MEIMCPLSLTSINERVAQSNAAITVVLLLFYLFSAHKWLIVVLGVDFFIRGFLNPAYSYFGAAGKAIVRILNLRPVMVDSGPKIFAAKIGFLFCCILALLEWSGFRASALIVGLVFAFFAGLEALFRLCVACRIYPYVHRLRCFPGR